MLFLFALLPLLAGWALFELFDGLNDSGGGSETGNAEDEELPIEPITPTVGPFLNADGDPLTGDQADDSIDGTEANDFILGRNGDDTLNGFAGDDTINGGPEADVIDGGTGNDLLEGRSGNDSIAGQTGDDTLIGNNGSDTLEGGEGNDSLNGAQGVDFLDGGDGDDFVSGESSDDTLFGGAGDDTLTGGLGRDFVFGESGTDEVLGGEWDDVLDGGTGDDLLVGFSGNDSLMGGANSDTLSGGSGDDMLLGGLGSDSLEGSMGDDTLSGGNAFSFGDDLPIDFNATPELAAALRALQESDPALATSGSNVDILASAPFSGIDPATALPISDDTSADYLSGGDGDDVIYLDQRDVGVGGAGADEFRLNSAAALPITVMDYDSTEDMIFIEYEPSGGAGPTVTVTDNSGNAQILVDGNLLATLRGAAGAITPADVNLVPLI